MARITDAERERKMKKAKELYIDRYSLSFIADTVEVKADTVKSWATEGKWDELKTQKVFSIKDVKRMILKCAEDISEGRKPAISPDAIAKLVAAWEKINDRDKRIANLYDAYIVLLDHVLAKAQGEKDIKKRQYVLDIVRFIEAETDAIINNAIRSTDE